MSWDINIGSSMPSEVERRVKRMGKMSRNLIPTRPQHPHKMSVEEATSAVCDVCGSYRFYNVHGKVFCSQCNNLLSSCCD